MSEREKKLLIFLGATLFVIVNLIVFNQVYLSRITSARAAKDDAETSLQTANGQLDMFDLYETEMAWLDRTGTTAVSQFRAQSELQEYLRRQAKTRRLEVRDTDILKYERGDYFGRVKVSFKVTGMENDVIAWLTSIHRIEQRQVVTRLEMKTQNNDPTRIEVDVEVEKWIIPAEEV